MKMIFSTPNGFVNVKTTIRLPSISPNMSKELREKLGLVDGSKYDDIRHSLLEPVEVKEIAPDLPDRLEVTRSEITYKFVRLPFVKKHDVLFGIAYTLDHVRVSHEFYNKWCHKVPNDAVIASNIEEFGNQNPDAIKFLNNIYLQHPTRFSGFIQMCKDQNRRGGDIFKCAGIINDTLHI